MQEYAWISLKPSTLIKPLYLQALSIPQKCPHGWSLDGPGWAIGIEASKTHDSGPKTILLCSSSSVTSSFLKVDVTFPRRSIDGLSIVTTWHVELFVSLSVLESAAGIVECSTVQSYKASEENVIWLSPVRRRVVVSLHIWGVFLIPKSRHKDS